jgi:hypothetical protein
MRFNPDDGPGAAERPESRDIMARVRAFLITAGTVFTLIVAAHFARIHAEPQLAHDVWFWLTTAVAAALSAWAWRLLRRMSRDGRRPRA